VSERGIETDLKRPFIINTKMDEKDFFQINFQVCAAWAYAGR